MNQKKFFLKIGGSLIRSKEPDILRNLLNKLNLLSDNFKLILLAGGGESANLIRSFDKNLNLTTTNAHFSAIAAMEQNSYILQNLLPKAKPLREIITLAKSNLIIFYPYQYFISKDPLPHSWDVTSDSIALHLSQKLNIENLILVKNVDGAYLNINSKTAKPLNKITKKELANSKVVDSYFTKFSNFPKHCWLVNGHNPKRIEKILKGQQTIASKVILD